MAWLDDYWMLFLEEIHAFKSGHSLQGDCSRTQVNKEDNASERQPKNRCCSFSASFARAQIHCLLIICFFKTFYGYTDIPWYTPSSDTAELWTVAKSTSRCNIPASKRSWCAEKGRHPCSHWREWTWIVSIYNIFRTGRTEPVKNESGLEEEPARNRFHRWASGRAISVEISCLTVLATALWAPSILCVARGALQLFLLGCCLSWLSLGILVNFLGLCFWTTFLELMDSFRFKRVLHASVARMVAVFQPNFCLLPYYVGEPTCVVYDRPGWPGTSPSGSAMDQGPDHGGPSGRQGRAKFTNVSGEERTLFVNHAKMSNIFCSQCPLDFPVYPRCILSLTCRASASGSLHCRGHGWPASGAGYIQFPGCCRMAAVLQFQRILCLKAGDLSFHHGILTLEGTSVVCNLWDESMLFPCVRRFEWCCCQWWECAGQLLHIFIANISPFVAVNLSAGGKSINSSRKCVRFLDASSFSKHVDMCRPSKCWEETWPIWTLTLDLYLVASSDRRGKVKLVSAQTCEGNLFWSPCSSQQSLNVPLKFFENDSIIQATTIWTLNPNKKNGLSTSWVQTWRPKSATYA